jgi:hypothetical protein
MKMGWKLWVAAFAACVVEIALRDFSRMNDAAVAGLYVGIFVRWVFTVYFVRWVVGKFQKSSS